MTGDGDGDDLIVVDPRSSPVWLNAKIGRFLVKVGLYLTAIIISCSSLFISHLSSQTPQSEAATRPQYGNHRHIEYNTTRMHDIRTDTCDTCNLALPQLFPTAFCFQELINIGYKPMIPNYINLSSICCHP